MLRNNIRRQLTRRIRILTARFLLLFSCVKATKNRPPMRTMTVNVDTETGLHLKVSMSSSESILDLKRKCADAMGVPSAEIDHFSIFYGGEKMKNEKKMAEFPDQALFKLVFSKKHMN